jgi:hypothetical protein
MAFDAEELRNTKDGVLTCLRVSIVGAQGLRPQSSIQ